MFFSGKLIERQIPGLRTKIRLREAGENKIATSQFPLHRCPFTDQVIF